MPKPKGGLGRGLSALIPQDLDTPQQPQPVPAEYLTPDTPDIQPSSVVRRPSSEGLIEVPTTAISPNPRQPRQEIRAGELDELAASIREHGILQPPVVTRDLDTNSYTLIAGERRWRAAILAGLQTIPVLVKEATPREMLELALVENLQRADLNPLEEAAAYKSLVDEFGLKQEEIASRVGKSREAVNNALRLLRLPPAIQESLMLGLITAGHARAILQVPTEDAQLKLLHHTVANGLNVRQVEALARRLAAHPDAAPQQKEEPDISQSPLYSEVHVLEDRFRTALGTKVQLSRSSRGGKLVIYFYSDEELDRIYGTIVGDEET
ncbi:MAG TPA: ParB/RepB/Spo0J family partition protein [Chloroflexia bacterium]|nr:ParB/RepB/Spo0J family partition protein [Chloroflexia bacterium]